MGGATLLEVLGEARRAGLLGPGPIEGHIEHALGFAAALEPHAPPLRALDLGSGGGVPGLVLAAEWADSSWVLLDAQARRASFLGDAVRALGLASRVEVRHARAEDAGREAVLRGAFDLVTVRSFGPPGVVAECAAPFLRVGGHAIVSEPPDSRGDRWDHDGLALVGLGLERIVANPAHYVVLEQHIACPSRFPRRAGVPERRPLF